MTHMCDQHAQHQKEQPVRFLSYSVVSIVFFLHSFFFLCLLKVQNQPCIDGLFFKGEGGGVLKFEMDRPQGGVGVLGPSREGLARGG